MKKIFILNVPYYVVFFDHNGEFIHSIHENDGEYSREYFDPMFTHFGISVDTIKLSPELTHRIDVGMHADKDLWDFIEDITKEILTFQKVVDKSYRGKLVEVIIKTFIENNPFELVENSKENLQDILDLNLKFHTKVSDIEIKNGITLIQIYFDDENGNGKVVDVTITSEKTKL